MTHFIPSFAFRSFCVRTLLLFALFVGGFFASSSLLQAAEGVEVFFELEGKKYSVTASSGSGEWLLRGHGSKKVLQTLRVSPRWSLDGKWSARLEEFGEKGVVIVLRQAPEGAKAREFIFVGAGELKGSELLWGGSRDTLEDPTQVRLVGPAGEREIIREQRDLRIPDCGASTASLQRAHFDQSKRQFVSEGLTWSANLASLSPLTWQVNDPVADALAHLVTRPGHTLFLVKGGKPGAPRRFEGINRLVDGNLESVLFSKKSSSILVIKAHSSSEVRSLLLVPPSGGWSGGGEVKAPLKVAWSGGSGQVSFEQLHASTLSKVPQGAMIPIPKHARCVVLEIPAGLKVAEATLLTALDDPGTGGGYAVLEGVVEDFLKAPTRRDAVRLRSILIFHPKRASKAALDRLKPLDAAGLERAFTLAKALKGSGALELSAAIATHPKANVETTRLALAHLNRYPKAVARILRDRIEGLSKGSNLYVDAAAQLALLDIPGALSPLLGEISRSKGDSPRQLALLERLQLAGPKVAPVLFKFLPAEELDNDTRVALMRVLLRVAPLWRIDPTKHPLPAELTLSSSLASSKLAVRILATRLVGAYRVAKDAPLLSERLSLAKVDVERAEAARTLGALEFLPVDPLLLAALEDPEPSVRIAAAEVLSSPIYATQTEVTAALVETLNNAKWPEVVSATLLGLGHAEHPLAYTKAQSLIEDPSAERMLRGAALQIFIDHPNVPWKTLSAWLDDDGLPRMKRGELLRAFMKERGVERGMERGVTLKAWLSVQLDKHRKGKGGVLLFDGLRALEEMGDPDLVSRIIEVERVAIDLALRRSLIEWMAQYDEPIVRERLGEILRSGDPDMAEGAQGALRKLDGLPPLPSFGDF